MKYSAQGVVLKGYLAYDENVRGKRPDVLVVHEWWGLNDYARIRAQNNFLLTTPILTSCQKGRPDTESLYGG